MNTAEKIIALRAERGISQQELADAVFVSRSLVSMWEAGTRIPDSLSVEKMAALFNVSEEEILSDRKYAFASSLERKLIGDEIAEYNIPVFVAYDGNDVWVKGVCEDMPDSWIKGSKTGNTVTFPTGQFFGTASILWFTFDYYFAGFENVGKDILIVNDMGKSTSNSAQRLEISLH